MIQHKTRVWTVRDLMKFAIGHLQRRGFGEARLNVELLLSAALDCPRIQLYTDSERPLTHQELKAFRALYERRLNREPVQYIVGHTSFMGLRFNVDTRVFIPRPETETLVEQAMIACQRFPPDREISIIEIGTGSGNIAVALAKFVRRAIITSIEASPQALEVARKNIELHDVESRIRLGHLDVFEPLDQLLLRRFDILVSNPPYVAAEDWEGLQQEVRRFEPKTALTDGKDGFVFHRRIVELAPYLLRNDGTVLLEVGYGQAETVMALMQEEGYTDYRAVSDLQNIPRVVIGRCPSRVRSRDHLN